MVLLKQYAALLGSALFNVVLAASPSLPQDLVNLASGARVEGPITAWCQGEFEPGRPGGYAIAVSSQNGGGRYLILGMNESSIELASFTGGADLSCRSAADAKQLNKAIIGAETVDGGISPIWKTTVVCGFLDNTRAQCWQYSPQVQAFVTVGQWTT